MYRKSSIFLLAIAATLAAACAMANIGSVRTSAEVARQFENLEINPTYRYWYLNQENNPFGVIGLDREYGFNGGPLGERLSRVHRRSRRSGAGGVVPGAKLNDNGIHHF